MQPKRIWSRLFWALVASTSAGLVMRGIAAGEALDSIAVHIQVDAAKPIGPWKPIWRFFGADEPNYATSPNGQKLLSELGALAPRSVYFRAHNLLTSGDGTPALKWGSTGAYDEDGTGRPIYRWTILDQIFDAYLDRGIRPYVEIGFMPRALSTHPEPYQHHWNPELGYHEIFTGWTYPPKDYRRWEELTFQWTTHCLEKYGRDEVEHWFWEVWNEPNIGYWHGSPEEFLKLHDYAVAGVRRALPTARVGGADMAGSGGAFTRHFLEHCLRGTNYASGRLGTPLDFVSFHAKGAPSYVDGHVRMGIANHLRTVAEGFRIISDYPELQGKPVVIGESDPEGCAACQGPQLAYRNGTLYPSYTAAVLARLFELTRRYHVNLEGALTWAFEFENQPYFAGFRSLASNGLDKPILNLFRMLCRMGGQSVPATSDSAVALDDILRQGVRGRPDVSALASLDGNRLCVLIWHYHDDDVPGPEARVDLHVAGIPEGARRVQVRHFRVDEDHSNAFTAWKRLGSPQSPSAEQTAHLVAAGKLAELSRRELQNATGTAKLDFALPRQGVSLLEFTW
jgi:xylan 1,4-beta-xylosidase